MVGDFIYNNELKLQFFLGPLQITASDLEFNKSPIEIMPSLCSLST